MRLTRQDARRFLLLHQQLLPPHQLAGKAGALAFVRRVRAVQFDPLNVVGRNPDLVLQSRVAGYRPDMLVSLLYDEFALVDGWDKMACIYPVEDWPLFSRWRESQRQRMLKRSAAVFEIIPQVRTALQERGPLSSIDLEHSDRVDWPWGPTRIARAALDGMHSLGEVVVHHRVGSRKVYDLAYRHLPAEVLNAPDPNPTDEAYQDACILRRLGSVGLLRAGIGVPWSGMTGVGAPQRKAAIDRLVTKGALIEVGVEGARWPYYVRCSEEDLISLAQHPIAEAPRVSLIAPLDNLTWDRDMLRALFDFEYRWEVYKPVVQRKYGYYVLPVLYGERFVARCEPVWDRGSDTLVIKNWWWEADVEITTVMCTAIRSCLENFATYLGLSNIASASDAVGKETLGALLG